MAQEKNITIALDVMGGDNAPFAVLSGANAVAEKNPHLSFLLFGRQTAIEKALKNYPALVSQSKICHAEDIVDSDAKPTTALRQGRNSSMFMSIQAVREGEAQAVVSAGNTGALMAMSKISLGTLEAIDRPAIVTALPSIKDPYVMLDLGANVECSARHLFQFAIMGDAFAKSVFHQSTPRIGFLNIGSEDVKGRDTIQEAAELLRSSVLSAQFIGNIEGHELADGKVDVVVADGFTGNIALKAIEGTGIFCRSLLEDAFKQNWRSKLGYLIAKPALKGMLKRIDPRLYNGAMFVGLNGIVVKSHGFADALAYENAIIVAYELVKNHVNDLIMNELMLVDTPPKKEEKDDKVEASEIASAIAMS